MQTSTGEKFTFNYSVKTHTFMTFRMTLFEIPGM